MDPQVEQSQLALSLLIQQLFPRPTECPAAPETEDDKRVSQRALASLISRLFHPHKDAVPIVHPSFKSLGRLWIPLQFVLPTNGLERFLSQHPHAPSLCLLGREGACKAGLACNQIHIDQAYGALIEEALLAQSVSTCCQHHGDPASAHCDIFSLSQLQNIEVRIEGHSPFRVPPQRIAVTYFWYKLLKQKRRTVWFPAARICALHQQDACRYGVECKHVHLCRQLWAEISKQTDPVILAGGPSVDPISTAEPPMEHGPSPAPPPTSAVPRASRAIPILDPVSGAEVTISRPGNCSPPTALEVAATTGGPSHSPGAPTPSPAPAPSAPSPSSPLSPGLEAPYAAFVDQQQAAQVPDSGCSSASVHRSSIPSESPAPPVASPTTVVEEEVETSLGGRAFPKPEKKKTAKRAEDATSPRASPPPPPDPEWQRKMEASRGKYKRLREGVLLGIDVRPGPDGGRPGFGVGRGRTIPTTDPKPEV